MIDQDENGDSRVERSGVERERERSRLLVDGNTSDGHVSEDACDASDLKVPLLGGGLRSNGGSGKHQMEAILSSPSSPPVGSTNFASRGVQIKSEKVLISILEGVHSQSDQTYILYKCCLCGFAFPSLEPMMNHVQTMHSNQTSNNLACDKCGACFRWKSELQLHEQLHQAMDQHQQPQQGISSSNVFPITPSTTSSSSVVSNPLSKSPLLSHLPHLGPLGPLTSHLNGFALPNLVLFNPFGLNADGATSLLNNNSNNNSPLLSTQSNGIISGSSSTSRDSLNKRKDSASSSASSSHVNGHTDTFPEQVLNLSKSGPSFTSASASLRESSGDVDRSRCDSPSTITNKSKFLLESVVRSQLESSKMEEGLNLLKFAGRGGLSSLANASLAMHPHHASSPHLSATSSPSLMPPGKVPSPLGEIEETSPGQFKCRYCDKTFDRIFSVHRHERVHTGYKPCICKVCGRGFSEKRNLRHHIIRFHSDGSGRELLKRARKDKSLAASTKQLAASVLKNAAFAFEQQQQQQFEQQCSAAMSAASANLHFDVKREPDLPGSQHHQQQSPNSRDRDDSRLRPNHQSLPSDERNHERREEDEGDDRTTGHIEPGSPSERNLRSSRSFAEANTTSVITRIGHPSSSLPSPPSSSRRRKGKPSKKIMRTSPCPEDDDSRLEEQGQLQVVEDDDNSIADEQDYREKKLSFNGCREGEKMKRELEEDEDMEEEDGNEMDDDMDDNERRLQRTGSKSIDGHLSASDNSNGGNQSDTNSMDGGSSSGGNSSRLRGHGAFFSTLR